MANTMTGRVLLIDKVEVIPSKNGGEPFRKRRVVLNCTHSDFGKVFENYPCFEFTGKHIDEPTAFKVDDIVTVSFVLQGVAVKKDNLPPNYFNTVIGYKIESYRRGGGGQTQVSPTDQIAASPHYSQPMTKDDSDLPF